MAMGFVPQMQNYFGKDTDFTKLSSAYGDSNALGVQSDIQGGLIRDQAKKRAEMRLMAGEHALSQGQQAGSHATTSGIISGIEGLGGGFLKGGLKDGGFLRGGNNPFQDVSSNDILTNDVGLAQDWSQSGGDNFTYWDSDMDTSTSALRRF